MLATSSSGERSFSRVKTYLQSTMRQSKLNHFMLLKHKELLDNYGLVSVAMNLFKLMWRVIMMFY